MPSFLLYTTQYCGFCYHAKELLDSLGIVYQEISVDNLPLLRQEMVNLSGGTTVPQIFIDEKPIGGCDELFALMRSGELNQIINQVPEA